MHNQTDINTHGFQLNLIANKPTYHDKLANKKIQSTAC